MACRRAGLGAPPGAFQRQEREGPGVQPGHRVPGTRPEDQLREFRACRWQRARAERHAVLLAGQHGCGQPRRDVRLVQRRRLLLVAGVVRGSRPDPCPEKIWGEGARQQVERAGPATLEACAELAQMERDRHGEFARRGGQAAPRGPAARSWCPRLACLRPLPHGGDLRPQQFHVRWCSASAPSPPQSAGRHSQAWTRSVSAGSAASASQARKRRAASATSISVTW
jgi:hypothetical protein